MPRISKQTISQFMKTGCYRQLKFALSPHDNKKYEEERKVLKIPPRQEPRPGMALVTMAGEEWERKKYSDVRNFLSEFKIIGIEDGHGGYVPTKLSEVLRSAVPESFVMQPEYTIANSLSFDKIFQVSKLQSICSIGEIEFSKLRPDIVQVLPPKTYGYYIREDGKSIPVASNSTALQLKVIDIKHTSEPSVAHFSELVYYMITLSCWLADRGLDSSAQVVSGAVWPGSHEASTLQKNVRKYQEQSKECTADDLLSWLNQDLIEIPFEVFMGKITHFFKTDLPYVLQRSWEALPYHVDASCKHCDYLGYPWKDSQGRPTYNEDHCMQLALKEDELSRVADMSKAAKKALMQKGVMHGRELAALNSTDPALDSHQTLKSKRILYPKRAISLLSGISILPDNVGTSSVMPQWSDLNIFLMVDFDITSAITACIGMEAIWINPSQKEDIHVWPAKHRPALVEVVESKDIEVEKRALINFLGNLQNITDEVKRLYADSTYQIYVWDSIQFNHLRRIVGRHLESIVQNQRIKDLAWLFPAEETVENPDMQRESPITIVKDCINAFAALPIPHYYSLLQTARIYGDPEHESSFHVHPLFEDALSDQIPSERIHEIWTKISTPFLNWSSQLNIMNETTQKRLKALHKVTQKLQKDMRPHLLEQAPKLSSPIAPKKQAKMCYQSQLLFLFSKLDAKLGELDVLAKRALPNYEREATFNSAILSERIDDKEPYLLKYNICSADHMYSYVYRIAPNSVNARVKDGDFLLALSPECDATFLNRTATTMLPNVPQSIQFQKMQDILRVTLLKFDREQRIAILKIRPYKDLDNQDCDPIETLETAGKYNFGRNVSLDPVAKDYFTPKLQAALQRIGNPPCADTNIDPLVRLKQTGFERISARRTVDSPAAKLLWDKNGYKNFANVLMRGLSDSEVKGVLDQARHSVEQNGVPLNKSQRVAWEHALTNSVSIIWGPPGTGKSKTLVSLIESAVLISKARKMPLRVLVSAFTYTAIDNLLLDAVKKINSSDATLVRVSSEGRTDADYPKQLQQVVLTNQKTCALRDNLEKNIGITIVGAPPQQVHKLLTNEKNYAPKELFDFVIIDEASQMNMANAVLVFSSIVMGGTLILAGDGLQLPPIHKAEIPLGCESKLGSVYDYYREEMGIEPTMLEENYRSNIDIVNFIKEAGYKEGLKSHSPNLAIRLNWEDMQKKCLPDMVCACDGWLDILNPVKKICCFTYPDGVSSQWNEFEAKAIVALCAYLRGSMYAQLEGEIDQNGQLISISDKLYSDEEFWSKGIGIVTPHRAQQSKISNLLVSCFSDGDIKRQALIPQCVDTVERFQGQQRDIIIASFALGDTDMIGQEEEFILNLNRFNVMASRARAKLIVFMSEELANYLAHDIDVLNSSKLLCKFANTYCDKQMPLSLEYFQDGKKTEMHGTLKYVR